MRGMGGRKRKSLYARTVHALQAVIAGELERGRALPLEVGALTVQGAGGPPAHRQHGPTISLEVAGRVYTATRTMLRGRILWLVDLRVDDSAAALLAPLVDAARRYQGRADLDVRGALEVALRLLQPAPAAVA